ITNLKPGEEHEDPERRYRVVDENMKIEERTLGKIKKELHLDLCSLTNPRQSKSSFYADL
ncbi:unnamed protein product, partial [Brassica oleracea var. botrytis]